MAFLDPIRDGKRSYVLRALQPSEDRVTLDGSRQTPGELTGALELMASCTAWGHLRGAGRDNSASPQELVDYGLSRRRRGALVRAADELARKVRRDWRNFAEAYDDGLLRS